jgi:8-oxo-dGTP diphosphatase
MTVDVVLLTLKDTRLHVALHRREKAPFEGKWALPGGYVHPGTDEDSAMSAVRILAEKTGLQSPYLEQLATFASSTRDPRGWSASIAYYAVVAEDLIPPSTPDRLKWVAVDEVRGLPFDHSEIVKAAVARIRSKAVYSSLPVHLMPPQFSLTQLQSVYEAVMDGALDKRTFRRWVEQLDMVQACADGGASRGAHRPAQLYELKPAYMRQLVLAHKTLDLK